MQCSSCRHWITRRYTQYGDGSVLENWAAPVGSGDCDILNQTTTPDFGCIRYEAGGHEQVTHKTGAPWQNWQFGPCPECKGVGCHMVELRPACRRCAGLGQVRHYDDGYIADATWDHPKEKELKKRARDGDVRDRIRREAAQFGLAIADTPNPGETLAPKKKDEGLFEGGSL